MDRPDPTPGVPPAPTLGDYWQVLARNRSFVVVFVLSAVLTALALTYVFSEKYESYTAISYRVQEVTRFKPQQNEAVGSPAPMAPFKVIAQTLGEVLRSDAILGDTVAALRLDEKRTGYEGPWYLVWYQQTRDELKEFARKAWMLLKFGRLVEEDATQAAIADLRDNLKLTNRDSYIFLLSVRDRYPERAAQIADHLGHVLAAWLLEFDRQPGRSRADQLEALLVERRAAMDKLRKEIESLLDANRVASVPLETERLTVNLSALQLELSRLDSDIARARTRQASVESKLAIKERILSGGGSPTAALAGMAAAPATPAEPVERIQPDDFRKLASQQVFEGLDLSSLLAKREALQSSIDALSGRLRKLPAIQTRLDTLRVALTAVERDYSLLNDSYQEAAVRASSPVSEVKVLHPAVVPTGPVTPIKVYHVLLAGGLSLLLAVGLVYLLSFLGIGILFPPPKRAAEPPPAAGDAPAAPEGGKAGGHD